METKMAGRPKTVVSKDVLLNILHDIEKNGPLANRSLLWQAFDSHIDAIFHGITGSIARSRMEQWRIEPLTPKGRRGRQKGVVINTGKRTSRKQKFESSPKAMKAFQNLRKNTDKEHLVIVDAIQNGSLKAAVKLHCIQCSGGSKSEVKQCGITSCPLWNFRPYKMAEQQQQPQQQQDAA